MTYSVQRPFLKNHTQHNFATSARNEQSFIDDGRHFPVLHQLNTIFDEKWGLSIDYDSIQEYYGSDPITIAKNKSGIDCSFNLVDSETRKIKRRILLLIGRSDSLIPLPFMMIFLQRSSVRILDLILVRFLCLVGQFVIIK